MAITTQHLLPEVADKICADLAQVWYFAVNFLHVLSGCVIRPAIDLGINKALFGNLLAVLIVGSLARMVGDVFVCISWQWGVLKKNPTQWTTSEWYDLGRRVAFTWIVTTPKATLQAALGPKVAVTFAESEDKSYRAPAAFIAPAAAVSILYCATVGMYLTNTVGKALALYFEDQEKEAQSASNGQLKHIFDGQLIQIESGGGVFMQHREPKLVATGLSSDQFESLRGQKR